MTMRERTKDHATEECAGDTGKKREDKMENEIEKNGMKESLQLKTQD